MSDKCTCSLCNPHPVKDWLDRNYRFIMLVSMLVEIGLLVVIVIQGAK